MTNQEWVDAFNAAMADFIAERPIAACSVRITFRQSEPVMVKGMRVGPFPGSLLIDLYPRDMSTMVKRDDHEHVGLDATPSRMLVLLPDIRSVEFMVEAPGSHPLGFAAQ